MMSSSPHRVEFGSPLRDVQVVLKNDRLVSELAIHEAEQESFQRGFEAGQKTMAEQLVEQRKQILELQRGVIQSLQQVLPGLVRQHEAALVELAVACAKRVIGETPVSIERLQAVIREATTGLQATSKYEVYLNPADLAVLREIQGGLSPADKKAEYLGDSGVARGGCIVKSQFGMVDATLETKLRRMEQEVL